MQVSLLMCFLILCLRQHRFYFASYTLVAVPLLLAHRFVVLRKELRCWHMLTSRKLHVASKAILFSCSWCAFWYHEQRFFHSWIVLYMMVYFECFAVWFYFYFTSSILTSRCWIQNRFGRFICAVCVTTELFSYVVIFLITLVNNLELLLPAHLLSRSALLVIFPLCFEWTPTPATFTSLCRLWVPSCWLPLVCCETLVHSHISVWWA